MIDEPLSFFLGIIFLFFFAVLDFTNYLDPIASCAMYAMDTTHPSWWMVRESEIKSETIQSISPYRGLFCTSYTACGIESSLTLALAMLAL
jgi:hypothetical protein